MRKKVHFDFNHHKEAKMNDLRERYFSIEQSLFPMVEEEFGELTTKMKEFISLLYGFRVCRTKRRSHGGVRPE